MTITQMQYFVAVCEYGTISKSAEMLHISQPSISLAIKDLEEQLGVTLFDRENKRFQLSQEGKYMYEVTKDILRKLESSVSGTWIMAVCRMPQYHDAEFGKRVIVLDDVQDPGNVGTIIRTAVSFGYDAVLLSAHSCDVYNEKVIRSTQGALFHIPVIRGDVQAMLMSLKQKGNRILATSLHNASALREIAVPDAFALVFGNEGKGVSEEVLRLADTHVFIEMHTFESLNVAVAAGICMYAFKK